MTDVALWSTAAVAGPLLGAILTLVRGRLFTQLGLAVAAASSLLAGLGLTRIVALEGPGRHLLGGWGAPLGIELLADGLAVIMLLTTAGVGSAVSLYATAYFGDVDDPGMDVAPGGRAARFFTPVWLLLWTSLNGVFLSGDLFNLYVNLEILGLSAAAVVTLAVTAKATLAGMRYLLVSLVGSMLFLLGVALLYTAYGTLSLEGLAAAGPTGVVPAVALGAMTVGLAAKTALFPLHAWLPPAHSAAPAPGSALLSALVVKASFYIIVRLWLHVYGVGLVGAGEGALLFLGALGAGAVVWGSLLALRQLSLKRLIAYSTVAQIGYLFIMFPLLPEVAGGVAQEGEMGWRVDAWGGGIYHAVSHAFAKAAMFLAAGTMTYAVADDSLPSISGIAHRLPMSFLAFGLGGLSLAGLPPSGGFVAKWLMLSAALATDRWLWAGIIALGGLLTIAYVLLVMRYALEVRETPTAFRSVPRRMEWTAMALALTAVALGFRAVEILDLLDVGGAAPW